MFTTHTDNVPRPENGHILLAVQNDEYARLNNDEYARLNNDEYARLNNDEYARLNEDDSDDPNEDEGNSENDESKEDDNSEHEESKNCKQIGRQIGRLVGHVYRRLGQSQRSLYVARNISEVAWILETAIRGQAENPNFDKYFQKKLRKSAGDLTKVLDNLSARLDKSLKNSKSKDGVVKAMQHFMKVTNRVVNVLTHELPQTNAFNFVEDELYPFVQKFTRKNSRYYEAWENEIELEASGEKHWGLADTQEEKCHVCDHRNFIVAVERFEASMRHLTTATDRGFVVYGYIAIQQVIETWKELSVYIPQGTEVDRDSNDIEQSRQGTDVVRDSNDMLQYVIQKAWKRLTKTEKDQRSLKIQMQKAVHMVTSAFTSCPKCTNISSGVNSVLRAVIERENTLLSPSLKLLRRYKSGDETRQELVESGNELNRSARDMLVKLTDGSTDQNSMLLEGFGEYFNLFQGFVDAGLAFAGLKELVERRLIMAAISTVSRRSIYFLIAMKILSIDPTYNNRKTLATTEANQLSESITNIIEDAVEPSAKPKDLKEKEKIDWYVLQTVLHLEEDIVMYVLKSKDNLKSTRLLRFAVQRKFQKVTEELLDRGGVVFGDTQSTRKDKQKPTHGQCLVTDQTALHVALWSDDDNTAAMLVKHVTKKEGKSSVKKLKSLNLIHNAEECVNIIDGTFPKTLSVVLDTLKEKTKGNEYKLNIGALDKKVHTPTMSDQTAPTAFQLIVDLQPEDRLTYLSHPVVWWLMERKARMRLWLNVMPYFISLVCFTISVAIAVDQQDILNYSGPLNIVRAACEGVIYTFAVVWFTMEFILFLRLPREYFNLTNVHESTAAFLVIVAFTTRLVDHQGHWFLLSAAYILWVTKIYVFTHEFRGLGIYVETIRRILLHDILYFLGVFTVVLLGFSGGFLLILRATHEEMLTFVELFYIGFRTLTEAADMLEYAKYGLHSQVLFLAFMFLTVVVMLNMLIAQMSSTYQKTQEDALEWFLFSRADMLARAERNTPWVHRFLRKRFWIHVLNETDHVTKIEMKECLQTLKAREQEATRNMINTSQLKTDRKLCEIEKRLDEHMKAIGVAQQTTELMLEDRINALLNKTVALETLMKIQVDEQVEKTLLNKTVALEALRGKKNRQTNN